MPSYRSKSYMLLSLVGFVFVLPLSVWADPVKPEEPLTTRNPLALNDDPTDNFLYDSSTKDVITHKTFDPKVGIDTLSYLKDSPTIIAILSNHTVFQSSTEGYSWSPLLPDEHITKFLSHPFVDGRAYLFSNSTKLFHTTDRGNEWTETQTPIRLNTPLIFHHDHSKPDYLIGTGAVDCEDMTFETCHQDTYYSIDNGQTWHLVDTYTNTCWWGQDVDASEILCEMSSEKKGMGMARFGRSVQVVSGKNFFREEDRVVAFENTTMLGTQRLSKSLFVTQTNSSSFMGILQDPVRPYISTDGKMFHKVILPEGVSLHQFRYHILESASSGTIFIHTSSQSASDISSASKWGTLLKSNSNGTVFSISAEYVYRDSFIKMGFEIVDGMDKVLLANVVTNNEVDVYDDFTSMDDGMLRLQSRISFDDGETWQALQAPTENLHGEPYRCESSPCALHLHTLQPSLFSDESTLNRTSSHNPKLLFGVGNVGETLAPYHESDTFISTDGGLTWTQAYQKPHIWSIGGNGNLWVMVENARSTDHVVYSRDQGKSWIEYKFSEKKLKVSSLKTALGGESEKFVLVGREVKEAKHGVVIHIDFSDGRAEENG